MNDLASLKIPEDYRLLLDVDMQGGRIVIRYNRTVVYQCSFLQREQLSLEPLVLHPSRGELNIFAEDRQSRRLPRSINLLVVSKDLQDIKVCKSVPFHHAVETPLGFSEELSFQVIGE